MDDGLTVSGGAGGVTARVEDLLTAAGLLRVAAGQLAAVAFRLGRVLADPGLDASGVLCPPTFAAAGGALLAATAGPHGLAAAAARLEGLSGGLAAAGHGYALAERAALAAGHEADRAAGRLGADALLAAAPFLLVAGAATEVGAGAASALWRATGGAPGLPAELSASLRRSAGGWLAGELAGHAGVVERAVDAVPGGLEEVVSKVPGLGPAWGAAAGTGWPPRSMAGAAALAGPLAVLVPGLREPSPVQVQVAAPRPVDPPRDLAALADRIDGCYPGAGARPGTVRVEVVTGADGRRAWVVAVPGTQTWSAGGPNPFDLAGNIQGLGERDTAARRTVVAAMEAAGVPPGEPVLLAGHSQGGMVAAGLAADPAFRSRFRVTHVLTLGSPVASYPVPDGVAVLSVEHADDIVPRLDGRANPDRPGWVTVSRRASAPGAAADPVATHELTAYRHTLHLVDASADPSLARWREGLGAFLDRPGATATAVEVSGVRELRTGDPGGGPR